MMSLKPGRELNIHRYLYYSEMQFDISELVKLSQEKLKEMEQDSIDKEKAIYAKLGEVENEWAQQARQTDRARKALQYLKTQPAPHTENVWKEGEYGWHEISNMVYKMTWRVYENTRYDKAAGKAVAVSWELSWYLVFNTPQNPDVSGAGRRIAGQERKRFTDKVAMEKYLQGRINAYAHLFTGISPPIPKGEKGRFSINGVLLPGYTVEVPERTPKEAADELLALLSDEDMPLTQPPEAKVPPAQPTPKKVPVHKPKKHTPTR